MQSPYFADPNITNAYQAAIPKIDFTGCVPFNAHHLRHEFALLSAPVDRQPQLLEQLRHRRGADAGADSAFAQMLTPTNIDPSLVVSKALTLTQGTIASGANRYDADTIAKYEFQTGTGSVAYDTSGIDPVGRPHHHRQRDLGRRLGRERRRGRQAAGHDLGEFEALQPDPGDGRVLHRGLGRTRAGGGRQLLHGQLLGRRHHAQLHAGADQPGLRLHAAQLEFGI
jgi:hypothetical protein